MSKSNTLIVVAVFLIIAIALAFGNPYASQWPLKCPLHMLTGWQCPLCGMQRACHELLNGNFHEAWRLNAGFIVALPYFAILISGQFCKKIRTTFIVKASLNNKTILGFFLIAAAWGIARNIFQV